MNEALSIGQPVSTDNPLVQDMLDRFKAKLIYSIHISILILP